MGIKTSTPQPKYYKGQHVYHASIEMMTNNEPPDEFMVLDVERDIRIRRFVYTVMPFGAATATEPFLPAPDIGPDQLRSIEEWELYTLAGIKKRYRQHGKNMAEQRRLEIMKMKAVASGGKRYAIYSYMARRKHVKSVF